MVYDNRMEETLEERGRILHDPEAALNCLLPAACQTKGNEEFLKDIPHREVLDLSVYYTVLIQTRTEYGRISFEDTEQTTGRAVVRNSLLAEWHRLAGMPVTEDRLFEEALVNAKESHVTRELSFGVYGAEFAKSENLKPGEMYVSTNVFNYHGAVNAVLGVGLEEAARVNQADIFIVPISVHESILVPKDLCPATEAEDVAALFYGACQRHINRQERLSGSLYRYSLKTKQISLAYDEASAKAQLLPDMQAQDELFYIYGNAKPGHRELPRQKENKGTNQRRRR